MRILVISLVLALGIGGCCASHLFDRPADAIGGDSADAPDALDASPDTNGPCAPQDARFSPPPACRPGVTGALWDGRSCVVVERGPGCTCSGTDCDEVYDSVDACVGARRACYAPVCQPQAATDSMCIVCDGGTLAFLGAFWDGRECVELWGCTCTGEGCATGFASLDECRAVESVCDASLCGATGGNWFPAEAGFCGFPCGAPSALACTMDSCNCGPGRSFRPGVGCESDPACTLADRCGATAGRLHPASECACFWQCGIPEYACGMDCADSCDCGPLRRFDGTLGCVPDPRCDGSTVSLEGVCAATGGTWHAGSIDCPFDCGHSMCWDATGCDCGWMRNFRLPDGCVWDPDCTLRDEGRECSSATCRPGLLCCASCGTAPGCATCMPPCPCCGGGPDGCPPPPP